MLSTSSPNYQTDQTDMTNTKTDTEQAFRAMRLHNEEMSMERNIGDMLPMLLPNDRDDQNAQFKVGQWVDNIKSILTDEQVETKLWVRIACRKIPIEKRVEFKEWATKNGRRNEDMDALRDFLLESYVSAATRLDVWRRFRALKTPTNLAELDQYVDQFKTYVILLGMKLEDEYTALFFSDKLPLDVMDKLVANLAPKDTVKFVDLVTRAQSFFHVYKNVGIPMEVDALNTPRRPGLPPYSRISKFCTLDEYNERAKANVCLACGQDHILRHCPKNRPNATRN
ncbi:hypothetical protein LPJ66_009710 [Kickxella alabastrina]|uniref:Uncharacterized protein n=1 Tax=Kickxella alabastrina TaxID=61397 RepID=A0ACC1I511_9FUNG|nr:hypothetical protein LPJ66_009710 [Kickxella alabastrina]